MENYIYSLSSKFPGGLDNTFRLQELITNNGVITTNIDHIDTNDDELKLFFDSSLSQTELDEIDLIMANYTNLNENFKLDYVQDSTQSCTTSTTFVNRSTLNLTGIPSGKYKILWNYDWGVTDPDTTFLARVSLNTTIIDEYSQKANIADITHKIRVNGSSYLDIIGGDHTITLDYCATNGVISCVHISNSRLEISRIQ